MPAFRIVLEYDGTGFRGWQVQGQGERTVQGVLEAAIEQVTGAAAAVTGAGRTDAGVHAEAQVASARIETRLDASTLQRALNAVLPRDLAVRALEVAPDDFHARRDATAKLYVYRLWNAATRSPLRERTMLWCPESLDRPAMRAALGALVGTHDFASFQAAGSKPGPTVRRLDRADLIEEGPCLAFELAGSGFLRHMVRNVVGTVLEVGRGRRSAGSMPDLIAARDRSAAGPTAPPHGLTLVRVEYAAKPADCGRKSGSSRVDGPAAHG